MADRAWRREGCGAAADRNGDVPERAKVAWVGAVLGTVRYQNKWAGSSLCSGRILLCAGPRGCTVWGRQGSKQAYSACCNAQDTELQEHKTPSHARSPLTTGVAGPVTVTWLGHSYCVFRVEDALSYLVLWTCLETHRRVRVCRVPPWYKKHRQRMACLYGAPARCCMELALVISYIQSLCFFTLYTATRTTEVRYILLRYTKKNQKNSPSTFQHDAHNYIHISLPTSTA